MMRKLCRKLLYDCQTTGRENDALVFADGRFLRTRLSAYIKASYPFISAYRVDAPTGRLIEMSSLPQVQFVSSVKRASVQMDEVRNMARFSAASDFCFEATNASLAIIDTGVCNHLDFRYPQSACLKFVDFLSGKTALYDDNGHGTSIAGAAVGSGLISGGKYRGITRGKFIMLKCLDSQGSGSTFDILSGMQWIYDNMREYKIGVVCMSFGTEPQNSFDPLARGADVLARRGVTVVAACGNGGLTGSGLTSPAVASGALAVGSYDDGRGNNGKASAASFSSRGNRYRMPDMLFPGVDICTAQTDGYGVSSGTSVSAAIASGTILALGDALNTFDVRNIRSVLYPLCKKTFSDDEYEGRGIAELSRIAETVWKLKH